MSLSNQIALDARLMFDHATQVILEGASQVLQQTIAATQCNNNLISFNNILSIGQNVVIDPFINIQYTVAVEVLVNNQTDINTFPGTINNVNTNINLAVITAVCRENYASEDMRSELLSRCPSDNNKGPVLWNQNTAMALPTPAGAAQQIVNPNANWIIDQPNTPSQLCGGRSRVSIRPVSVAAIADNAQIITYEITEPIFIAPLVLGKGGAGLCNVNSFGVRFQLDTSSSMLNMFNATQVVTNAMLANTTINITTAKLLINYLTVDVVDHPIPNPAFYDWYQVDVNTTTLSSIPAIGASPAPLGNQSCNSYKLTTIPKFYWLKLMPEVSAVKAHNLMCGFPIESLQITYGSYGQFIFTRDQLYYTYRRNTGHTGISYEQWVNLGCPVCINPSLDMCSANSFSGESNLGGLMFQSVVKYTLENYNTANTNLAACDITTCLAYELFVTQGSCAIGNGVAVFKNSSLSMEEFAQLSDRQPVVSENVVAASQMDGGKFNFGSFKSILNSGAKKLGELAIKHGPDLAKKGIEMGLEQLTKGGGYSSSGGTSGGRMR